MTPSPATAAPPSRASTPPSQPATADPAAPSLQHPPVAPLLYRVSRSAAFVRSRPLLAYTIALALFAAALGTRFAIDRSLPPGFPFLTFFPAIVFSVFLGGRGPGALCSILSVLAAWYWFVPPVNSLALTPQSGVAVAFFVAIAVVDVLVIDTMTRALDRLAEQQATTQQLLAQRTTLFQELQHRVANNLAGASLRMAVLQRRFAALPQVTAALAAERRSFDSLARIHRTLHDPDVADQPWGATVQRVIDDFMTTQPGQQVTVALAVPDDVRFDVDRGVTLSLLVLEALTNSLKHAYPGARPGRIRIGLSPMPDARFELTIEDDGIGMPAAPAADGAPRPDGLGQRILHNLTEEIGGSIGWEPAAGGGTRVVVRFPA